jgi:hypothetical protein
MDEDDSGKATRETTMTTVVLWHGAKELTTMTMPGRVREETLER